MAEIRALVFDKAGPQNTQATLELAGRRSDELGIDEIVVATSTGKTALEAARAMPGKRVIGVTLQAGLFDKYVGPDPDIVGPAEELGVQFVTCPHALMGSLDSAVKDKFGGLPPGEFISYVYYTFCQGMKVAVEVAMMAADAGRLSMDGDIIAIAGTENGADTAIVLTPAYTNEFFDLRVREILAKPR